MFDLKVNERRDQDLETEAVSFTRPLLRVEECRVSADIPGEEGPSPLMKGFLAWHVALEMAVAREIGIRQRPFPCRYCMADPMSSSISFATCCSVVARVSFELPLALLLFGWTQSPPPCSSKQRHHVTALVTIGCRERGKRGICESGHACCFWIVVLWWLRIWGLIDWWIISQRQHKKTTHSDNILWVLPLPFYFFLWNSSHVFFIIFLIFLSPLFYSYFSFNNSPIHKTGTLKGKWEKTIFSLGT